MSSAVVGLIGVVIGGLLAAGSNFLSARSAEKREERREVRRAVRLVQLELKAAHETFYLLNEELSKKDAAFEAATTTDEQYVAITETARVPSPELLLGLETGMVKPITTSRWESNQEVLAMALPDVAWSSVEAAYDRILQLRPAYQELCDRRELPDRADRWRIERVVEVTNEAIKALYPFSKLS
jgi:hypothetical protein